MLYTFRVMVLALVSLVLMGGSVCVVAVGDYQQSFDYLLAKTSWVNCTAGQPIALHSSRNQTIASGHCIDNRGVGSVYRLNILPVEGAEYVSVALKIFKNTNTGSAQLEKTIKTREQLGGLAIDFVPLETDLLVSDPHSNTRDFNRSTMLLMELYDNNLRDFVDSEFNKRNQRPLRGAWLNNVLSIVPGVLGQQARLVQRRLADERVQVEHFDTQLKDNLNKLLHHFYELENATSKRWGIQVKNGLPLNKLLVKQLDDNRLKMAFANVPLTPCSREPDFKLKPSVQLIQRIQFVHLLDSSLVVNNERTLFGHVG